MASTDSYRCDLCKDCESCDEDDYSLEAETKANYEEDSDHLSGDESDEETAGTDHEYYEDDDYETEEIRNEVPRTPSPMLKNGIVINEEKQIDDDEESGEDDDEWWYDMESDDEENPTEGSRRRHHHSDQEDDKKEIHHRHRHHHSDDEEENVNGRHKHHHNSRDKDDKKDSRKHYGHHHGSDDDDKGGHKNRHHHGSKGDDKGGHKNRHHHDSDDDGDKRGGHKNRHHHGSDDDSDKRGGHKNRHHRGSDDDSDKRGGHKNRHHHGSDDDSDKRGGHKNRHHHSSDDDDKGGHKNRHHHGSNKHDKSHGNRDSGDDCDDKVSKPGGGRKPNRRMHMTQIRMPTGKKFFITVPVQSKDQKPCKDKTRLITLWPKGQMGRREYTIVTKEVEKTVLSRRNQRHRGGFRGFDFVKVQKVVNCCMWRRYIHCRKQIFRQQGFVNEKMLFLGSKYADDIVEEAVHLKHHSRDGVFGNAIYLAKHSDVANKYVFSNRGGDTCRTHKRFECTHCKRKILLCRVALGKEYEERKPKEFDDAPRGYNSVQGVPSKSLRYYENALWDGAQVYPEYLVTYRIKK